MGLQVASAAAIADQRQPGTKTFFIIELVVVPERLKIVSTKIIKHLRNDVIDHFREL